MKPSLTFLLALGMASWLPAKAQRPGELRSLSAQAALSARYTQLWSALPASARPAFARRERRWLHVTRWDEQQRCVDAHAGALPSAERADLAAHCLAEVTLRRLNSLPVSALAQVP
jgi:hypothetical protein